MVGNVSFGSKYSVNINQPMKTKEDCLKRDFVLGVCYAKAKNGAEAMDQAKKFFAGEYNKNPQAACNVVLDMPDSMNAEFEDAMHTIGQNFSKIA